jgi:ubiquitin
MHKKLFVVVVVSIFFVALAHRVQASVEGDWDISNIEKVTAKVKKIAVARYTDDFSDTWTFSSENNQFAVDGVPFGTWDTVKNKFVVYVDGSVLNDMFTESLKEEGFPDDTQVTITSTKASGQMKKDGTIKGTYKFAGVVTTSGITGKLTVNGKFTGVKIGDDDSEIAMSEYFPLHKGDTWTYMEEDDELTVQTMVGTQKINGVTVAKIIDEDGDYNLFATAGGFGLYEQYDANDIPGCGWQKQIYNPPIKFSDSAVSVGSTYASTTTLTQTDCKGNSATVSLSYESKIEDFEDVTVPAGTFNNCLKITATITINGTTQTNEQQIWLAKGLGQVKSISIDKDNGSEVNRWTDDLVGAVVGGITYGNP